MKNRGPAIAPSTSPAPASFELALTTYCKALADVKLARDMMGKLLEAPAEVHGNLQVVRGALVRATGAVTDLIEGLEASWVRAAAADAERAGKKR